MNTILSQAYSQPAEWQPHRAVWLAWPSHENLWGEALPTVQQEFVELCRAIADVEGEKARGEKLEVLVPSEQEQAQAEKALAGLPVRFHPIAFGDIWLRDTAPIFVQSGAELACVSFRFNGWGGKYNLADDQGLSIRIAEATQLPLIRAEFVLEGGSVEVDGEGTALTTEQCLLNVNRNPEMTRSQLEEQLRTTLGVRKVLWLADGLLNDHTDGHIDTIARFTSPGVVVCMEARTAGDPNREVLDRIARDLEQMQDAQGRQLQVVRIPSPGRVVDEDGKVMAASYVNFYIANSTVVVPTYGTPFDNEAVEQIGRLFQGRKAVGCSALNILGGGGAFHCISQQEPL